MAVRFLSEAKASRQAMPKRSATAS